MAIGALTLDWLVRLAQRGAFPRGSSVLELGPQDLSLRAILIFHAAERLKRPREIAEAVFDGDWRHEKQAEFYRLFGASSCSALDLYDQRAAVCHDLNVALETNKTFDVICDFGTTEHVFNIGQGYANLHRLLAPGGLLLCASPSYGYINHGFYNIHPIAFVEAAAANAYDMLEYHYVDNWYVRCAARDEVVDQPFDFDSLPIKVAEIAATEKFMTAVAAQYQANLASAAKRRFPAHLIYDLSLVALRKTAASPERFIFPQQGTYANPAVALPSASTSFTASRRAPPHNLPVFEDCVQQQHISIKRNAAPAADGAITATKLRDASSRYATVFQDFAIEDDRDVHTFSIDIKAGSSPLAQIVMAYLGGKPEVYHIFIETDVMSVTGHGAVTRRRLSEDGWFRVTLSGANNASGNKTVRLQIYPRHGRPEDKGSLYIANGRLDP